MNTSQMNMTCTTRFLCFILLHIFLFTLTNAQSPYYMVNFCQNSTEKTNNTSYRSNVNNLLLWIDTDSATGSVSNHIAINSNKTNNNDNDGDVVYGFYDCRGDIIGSFCQFCINAAVRDIALRCPNGVSAMIWYDICVIGYSDHNTSGKISVTPSWNLTGTKTAKNSTELDKAVNDMRNLIGKVTAEANSNWAVGEFNWNDTEKRYGWVQCNSDLTKDGCRYCLETMLDKVPQCCGTKVKWAVVSPSCGMEIDDNKFYNFQTESPPSLPNPGKYHSLNFKSFRGIELQDNVVNAETLKIRMFVTKFSHEKRKSVPWFMETSFMITMKTCVIYLVFKSRRSQ